MCRPHPGGRAPAGLCPRHVPTPRSGSAIRDPGRWEGHPGFVASWGSGSGPVDPPPEHPSTLPPVSHPVLAPVESLSPTLQTCTQRHMDFIDRPVGTALPPPRPLKARRCWWGWGLRGAQAGAGCGWDWPSCWFWVWGPGTGSSGPRGHEVPGSSKHPGLWGAPAVGPCRGLPGPRPLGGSARPTDSGRAWRVRRRLLWLQRPVTTRATKMTL